MEIERKFLVKKLPQNLERYVCKEMEQGYLCTEPVVRIRHCDEDYILTYKGKGLLAREEYNLPLTSQSYEHLREKADGILIHKKRYLIPYQDHTIELDIFEGELAPLVFAEVEFDSERAAKEFVPPDWFDRDVTFSGKYQNSYLSRYGLAEIE